MNKAFLLLGTNLGNRSENLMLAGESIADRAGKVMRYSSIYETEPWGFEHENFFYNQVLEIQTSLKPDELLIELLKIEEEMGRVRQEGGYTARTIDIDILFFNDEIIETDNLIVPHPRLHERRFTLLPLVELIPDFTHPKLNQSLTWLLDNCKDNCKVKKV